MKTERFEYLYLLLGILGGFLLGSSLDPATAVWVRRIMAGGGVFILAFFWRRIESKSHRRHLEEWEELRHRGKWFFVLTRYVLVRGVVFLVILGGPAALESWYATTLLFFVAIFLPMLLYLGVLEWNDCQREYEIRTIRNAAEFISSKQN